MLVFNLFWRLEELVTGMRRTWLGGGTGVCQGRWREAGGRAQRSFFFLHTVSVSRSEGH